LQAVLAVRAMTRHLGGLPEQRFFVAYGQSWCTDEREENEMPASSGVPCGVPLGAFGQPRSARSGD
jgi:hypothetical protein